MCQVAYFICRPTAYQLNDAPTTESRYCTPLLTLLDGVKEDMARNGKLYVAILCLDKFVFSCLIVIALRLQACATAL